MDQQQKNSNQSVGGIWVKEGQKGRWLSISIEIDGVKRNFVGFKNDYKQEGDNKPDYRISLPRPREGSAAQDV